MCVTDEEARCEAKSVIFSIDHQNGNNTRPIVNTTGTDCNSRERWLDLDTSDPTIAQIVVVLPDHDQL